MLSVLEGTEAHHLVPTSLKFVGHGFNRDLATVSEVVNNSRNMARGDHPRQVTEKS
jgi:hypothetical protein